MAWDRQSLEMGFYSALDLGLATAELTGLLSGRPSSSMVLLGEGSHFRTFLVRGDQIVLKVPNENFFAEFGELGVAKWKKFFKEVLRSKVVLVPPMEFVEVEDSFGLIMPYGEELIPVARGRSEYSTQIAEFAEGLEALGLTLEDSPQLCRKNGVPFVYDFSALADARG